MDEFFFDQSSISEALFTQAIGADVVNYIRGCDPNAFAKPMETEAIRLLEKIRQILNDPDLDDSTCFLRIDAIVSAFWQSGIPVDRHDF